MNGLCMLVYVLDYFYEEFEYIIILIPKYTGKKIKDCCGEVCNGGNIYLNKYFIGEHKVYPRVSLSVMVVFFWV